MIKPVAFYNKISGKGYNKHTIHHNHSGDSTEDENVEQTSKYGYSDDPVEDEAMFNDDMDDD